MSRRHRGPTCVFVVNKADRPGANRMVAAMNAFLGTADSNGSWSTPVLATQAISGEGVPELYEKLREHREFLTHSSQLEERRRERRARELMEVLQEELGGKLRDLIQRDQRLSKLADQVKRGELEPYSSAIELLGEVPSPLDWLSQSLR